MKQKLKRYRLLIATLLILCMAVLVHLRAARPERFSGFDAAVMVLIRPLATSVHYLGSVFRGTVEGYINLIGLKEENARLQARIKALEEEVHHHLENSIQFQILKEQLAFFQHPPDPKVFAEIIGRSLDSAHHTLLINKGLRQGVRRNFPVVLREGVVGRIQSVSPNQAIIQLIVDPRHRFPAVLRPGSSAPGQSRTAPRQGRRSSRRQGQQAEGTVASSRGIVVGSAGGLQMQRIQMLTPVHAGDRVLTSGLAGVFPKGLLVGRVLSVHRGRHELFQTARIAPAVNFERLEGVFVVLRGARPGSLPFFSDSQNPGP